jgi:hypothetical protein
LISLKFREQLWITEEFCFDVQPSHIGTEVRIQEEGDRAYFSDDVRWLG